MQGANRGVIPTEICLTTPVTLIGDLNESSIELQVRLFLNDVINQPRNQIKERHIPYAPSHEILSEFISTQPSAPNLKVKMRLKTLTRCQTLN